MEKRTLRMPPSCDRGYERLRACKCILVVAYKDSLIHLTIEHSAGPYRQMLITKGTFLSTAHVERLIRDTIQVWLESWRDDDFDNWWAARVGKDIATHGDPDAPF